MVEKLDTFTVVYQTGGYRGEWRRFSRLFLNRVAALKEIAILEKLGFPAYVETTEFWDTIGLPEGRAPHWDYENLRRK